MAIKWKVDVGLDNSLIHALCKSHGYINKQTAIGNNGEKKVI